MIVQLSANETTKDKNQPSNLSWDWTAASLLLACGLLASGRLVVTEASDHLILISFLAILGGMGGLAVGYSRFSAWASAILSFAYGAFFIPWQLGLAFFGDQEWSARLRDLSGRLGFAIDQFISGKNVEDQLLFVAAMAILFWIFGFNAGYRLMRRGDVWGALIPFGIAILIVQIYDSRETWKGWFLALFLLCLLLLVARLRFIKQRQGWENSRIYIPFELSGSLGGLAFVSAALLVLFSWATPALASSLDSAESFWSTVTSPWRAIRDELNRALFSLRGEPTRTANAFGERFVLGRGIPQSPEILFTVQIIHQDQIPLRYYWQDRVYDHYENGNWSSSYDGLEVWDDADVETFTDLEGRTITQLLFTAQDNFTLLHSAPQPIALNREAKFTFATNEDGTEDVAALFASSPVQAGESYDLTASIAVPTANQLNSAGLDYPQWVTDRYLQLPADFSPRIAELAQGLTENLSTPYDKTVFITNYLRGELEYVERMPLAPLDRDPIEWALFDKKQGFCNYYASAEVLMLRSLGIPARLAVGYAHGERENVGGRTQYTVRLRDAHAWPEVYFPGIGWVEFEPTANQDPLIRPSNASETISLEEELRLLREERQGEFPSAQTAETSVLPESQNGQASQSVMTYLRTLLVLIGFLALGGALLWNRNRIQAGISIPALVARGLTRFDLPIPMVLTRWALVSELTPVQKAYTQVSRALTILGQAPKPGDTAQQRARALAKRLPFLDNELQTLSHDYESITYGKSRVKREERAVQTMRRIRWSARREQIRSWVQRIRRGIT